MAEIKAPIKIDGFKCVEDMAQAVLNYTYKGKTLKEWADSISEPQTNADLIRAMTDEELLFFLWWFADGSGKAKDQWLEWLKQKAQCTSE